MHLVDLEAV
ncbi:hypothetical protein G4B88_013158 [Cannabis sativa]|uniref:Uncharacterized protein n=1 Tax=Cannabis sativa TaxID=3483 RepID=A0A7J6GZY1_CANSA|nr:hypothetical protein G4B88_013158 [Cannabis sativa]